MINGKDNPVEWALMSYELEEVIEHLQHILDRIGSESEVDEIEFGFDMGHVYAHLNRIWNARKQTGEYSDAQRDEFSKFPIDIELVG